MSTVRQLVFNLVFRVGAPSLWRKKSYLLTWPSLSINQIIESGTWKPLLRLMKMDGIPKELKYGAAVGSTHSSFFERRCFLAPTRRYRLSFQQDDATYQRAKKKTITFLVGRVVAAFNLKTVGAKWSI